MRIEIVSTGDEVITGSIDDTNASFISRELLELGLQIHRRHTVGDNLKELQATFKEVSTRHSIVVVTGGLGPTNDDLTTEAIARVAQLPLELNTQWLERMQNWFKLHGRTMAKTNLKQAMLPKGALPIMNPIGTACGFMLKVDAAIFIFAPGVPKELKVMWDSSIKEIVLSFTQGTIPLTKVNRLFFMGIGESTMAEQINQIQLPKGIVLGDRATYPFIELKVIGHNAQETDLQQVLQEVMVKLAPFYVCKDSFNLLEHLALKQVNLQAITAIDGVCHGLFLLSLQEIFSDFVSCAVINNKHPITNGLSAADLDKLEEKYLSELPQDNYLTLLPHKSNRLKFYMQKEQNNDIDNSIALNKTSSIQNISQSNTLNESSFDLGSANLKANDTLNNNLSPNEQYEKTLAKMIALQQTNDTYIYKYVLNYKLSFKEQTKVRHLKGSILFELPYSIYEECSYIRNRKFIAKLACLELYKIVMQEELIYPNDMNIIHTEEENFLA